MLKVILRNTVEYAIEWYGLTQIAPTFTLQQIVFIMHRSRLNLGLLLVGFLIDAVAHVFADVTITGSRCKRLLSVFGELSDYELAPIDLEMLIPQDAQRDLYRGVYEPERLGKRSYMEKIAEPIWSQVRAYSVLPKPGAVPLKALTAFQDLDGCCTIFVPTKAERMTVYQRFMVRHEIGHATKFNALQLSRSAGIPVFRLFCLWALVMVDHTVERIGVVVVALSIQHYVRTRWKESPNNLGEAALLNELAADAFAVRHTDSGEIHRVNDLVSRKASQIVDPRLDAETNAIRQKALVASLNRRASGYDAPALRTQALPSFRIFLTLIFTSTLIAYQGQTKSNRKLLWASCLAVVLILAFCGQRRRVDELRGRVRSWLDDIASNNYPSPAQVVTQVP